MSLHADPCWPDRPTQPASVFEPALTTEDVNRIQEALEERAWSEVEQGAPLWADYVCDHHDTADLERIVRLLLCGPTIDAIAMASKMREDYVQHRVANAERIELEDIERELREKGEIEP